MMRDDVLLVYNWFDIMSFQRKREKRVTIPATVVWDGDSLKSCNSKAILLSQPSLVILKINKSVWGNFTFLKNYSAECHFCATLCGYSVPFYLENVLCF